MENLTSDRAREEVSFLILGDYSPSKELSENTSSRIEKLINQQEKERIFNQADYIIVNLECPLTNRSEGISKVGPHLKADPADATIFSELGVNIASLANNHIMDLGEKGLFDTLSFCENNGIKVVGAGKNLANASNPLILSRNGISIGILSVAENEFSIAGTNKPGANPLDLVDNYYQIVDLKTKVDIVFVIYHGGNEHYSLPSPRMRKTLRCFVDWGAHAVFCHHTHTVSGMETYHNSPIFYGLGNFLFDWSTPRPDGWYTGMLVNISVSKNKIEGFEIVPYTQSTGDVKIDILSGDRKDNFMTEFQKLSDIIRNEEALNSEWERFLLNNSRIYLSNYFGFNFIEVLLYKYFSLWPFWKASLNRIKTTLNYIKCESHRDVLVGALNSKIKDESD